MRLLIDTFNVLHVTGVLPPGLAGPDLRGLAALVLTSRWAGCHVAFICDGAPSPDGPHRLPAGMRAIYSRSREADDVIERLIADSTAPGHLLVISSDRRIRRAASRGGATDLDAERFLRCLLDDRRAGRAKAGSTPEQPRPASLRPGEIEAWRQTFKLGDSELEVGDDDLPPHLREALNQDRPATRTPSIQSSPPRPPDPASLLPDDLLAEARDLLRELGDRTDLPTQQPLRAQPDLGSSETPPPPRTSAADQGDLPEDVIRDAEAMLRNLKDSDEQQH